MHSTRDLFHGKFPSVGKGTLTYGVAMKKVIRWLTVLLVLPMSLTGCVTHYPADPHGTLDRVAGGELRVGVSHSPPSTSLESTPPTGHEVDLVNEYARTLNAHVTWTPGGEEELVNQMKNGQLDLIIGGLTKDSPWDKDVGLTRPYAESTDQFGDTQKHVMAVPNGENAFLLNLESFLATHGGRS